MKSSQQVEAQEVPQQLLCAELGHLLLVSCLHFCLHVAINIANDGLGSIRIPAAYTGTVGFKPDSSMPNLSSGDMTSKPKRPTAICVPRHSKSENVRAEAKTEEAKTEKSRQSALLLCMGHLSNF